VRRLALVAAALVVPVLPVLAAAPAFAVDNVICVPAKVAGCDAGAATIPLAITAANGNALDDTILVAPGSYTDGPYTLSGVAHAVTLKGSGQGSTVITLPSAGAQTYVTATHATVQDLTITLVPNASVATESGLKLASGSLVQRVTVNGAGTSNDRGVNLVDSQVKSSSILMPVSDPDSRGMAGIDGANTVTDTVITGAQGYVHSGAGITDTLSRVTIRAAYSGVEVDGGTANVDDTVIDLGSYGGTGLLAANGNNSSSPMAINADHLTIVGGAAGSRGVRADATVTGTKQTSAIKLSNSIIRGPATSLVAAAGNDGAQGGPSTATVNVSFTDYQTVSNPNLIAGNGTGGVVVGTGTVAGVDPGFVNVGAANYHLTPGSPVADKGNPAPAGPATDRDGGPRVLDGDPVVGAVRDMGAYELPAIAHPAPTPTPTVDTTAPDTTITTKLAKKLTKKKVKLAFSSEAGATFQCQVDGKAWTACTSPLKLKVKEGKHVVLVRAVDAAGNVDATPAKVKFKRVATPH
jgi:hypothetical protein